MVLYDRRQVDPLRTDADYQQILPRCGSFDDKHPCYCSRCGVVTFTGWTDEEDTVVLCPACADWLRRGGWS